MALSERSRRHVRRRLENLDLSPWHDVHNILVWRNGLQEYKLAFGREIVARGLSLDDAVEFIMANGFDA